VVPVGGTIVVVDVVPAVKVIIIILPLHTERSNKIPAAFSLSLVTIQNIIDHW